MPREQLAIRCLPAISTSEGQSQGLANANQAYTMLFNGEKQ